MNHVCAPLLCHALVFLHAASSLMATEEAKHTVVSSEGAFEIRDYDPCIVAEVVVAKPFEEAGNAAFGQLFRYISGANRSREKIAMTAPVAQQPVSQKIAMTTPVTQQGGGRGWTISFMMPESFTMESLPAPDDPAVRLRQVPARRMAAVRYSGRWTEAGYLKHKAALEAWIRENTLRITGEPVWARYDPPFQLWFLRRNEVLIPIAGP